jgi:hypothetical protein
MQASSYRFRVWFPETRSCLQEARHITTNHMMDTLALGIAKRMQDKLVLSFTPIF